MLSCFLAVMALIHAEDRHDPMRVFPQSNGQIFVSFCMLSLKFSFRHDHVFMEKEVFDDFR